MNPGDPCCPDCGFISAQAGSGSTDDEMDIERVEEVLRDYGYDLSDLRFNDIDEDDLEDILEELEVDDVDDLDV